MKKKLSLSFLLILLSLTVHAKWLGFKPILQSATLEKALLENAVIFSGFYPLKNSLDYTYTSLEAVDSISRGPFEDELLVEMTPGNHKISCKYEDKRSIKESLGKAVTFTYKFEKGKIYVPCGKILGKKWFVELKEYSSIEQLNSKCLKRIRKGFAQKRK